MIATLLLKIVLNLTLGNNIRTYFITRDILNLIFIIIYYEDYLNDKNLLLRFNYDLQLKLYYGIFLVNY